MKRGWLSDEGFQEALRDAVRQGRVRLISREPFVVNGEQRLVTLQMEIVEDQA